MIVAMIEEIAVREAAMVDGSLKLSERQKRALVAHQFE